MQVSRRTFLAASVAASAAVVAGSRSLRAAPVPTPLPAPAAEDGSKLWLRFASGKRFGKVTVQGTSATAGVAKKELEHLAGADAGVDEILACTTANAPAELPKEKLSAEGFQIVRQPVGGKSTIAIVGGGEMGMLYGVYHFLRLVHTGADVSKVNVKEEPKLKLRLTNHWDNPEGSIERGYAGRSLWKWAELPGKVDQRVIDYARASASIGINGAVLNNVNARDIMLTPDYLKKVEAIAAAWRPFGVRVYMSLYYAAPRTLGKLPTADPLDPQVIKWWKDKVDEIYSIIPDFGGFLVKANSEGQPGPKDYGRNHAQGANVLADALAPHGGSVVWRAFIYDEDVDPDRAKRAYIEFTKLDGQFKPNVLVQVKNGPIDFQPREPFHPLFGALPKTPVMLEIQATQEYLGQAKHLVYLGTMWEEVLQADTYAKGKGTRVSDVLQGKVYPYAVTGAACVLNTGTDVNWCGHDFSQANWYAYGRLAWDPDMSAKAIAQEWVKQTWSVPAAEETTLVDLMMSSRETFVNYTMPLGLHHLIGGDHYAPMPQNAGGARRDWTAVYYHQAAADGVGYERTRKGDKAVDQYFKPVADEFDDLAKCPDRFLLWFHHLPWDYKMKSGKTLWAELVEHYFAGAAAAAEMAKTWDSLSNVIDPQRHAAVAARLKIQVTDSALWRDRILAYFAGFSKMPVKIN